MPDVVGISHTAVSDGEWWDGGRRGGGRESGI